MIVALIALLGPLISAAITKYYFPKIVEVEKIVQVEKIVYRDVERPVTLSTTPSKFLSREERRELIASRVFDPSIQTLVHEAINNRDASFSGYKPDPEAQTNPNWRLKIK